MYKYENWEEECAINGYIEDINGDKKSELIITAFYGLPNGFARYISVVTLLNSSNYKKIGSLFFKIPPEDREVEVPGGTIPEVLEVKDIDGDKVKEIFVDFGSEGAASWGVGILDVDYKNKRLDWLKLQEENGKIEEAIFLEYAVACGGDSTTIADINKNGRKEIIRLSFRVGGGYESKKELSPWQKIEDAGDGMSLSYSAKAYEWNGSLFLFNPKISEEAVKLYSPEMPTWIKNLKRGKR